MVKVYTAGTQTITGTKTFTGGINVNTNNLICATAIGANGGITTSSGNLQLTAAGGSVVLLGQDLNVNNNAITNIDWSSSDDGAGSGLDADLLDAKQSGNASGNIPISNGTKCTNLNADLLDGYNVGNANGNIPVSNGTKCVNLNADMLDGRHLSLGYVSAISVGDGTSQPFNIGTNGDASSSRVAIANMIIEGATAGKISSYWSDTTGTTWTFRVANDSGGALNIGAMLIYLT